MNDPQSLTNLQSYFNDATLLSALNQCYDISQYNNALQSMIECAPAESREILNFLARFRLSKRDTSLPGGPKTKMTSAFESNVSALGWGSINNETTLFYQFTSNQRPRELPFVKGCLSVHWQWHSKDTVFDKILSDLDYFYQQKRISFGVIVTRSLSLYEAQRELDSTKYAKTTTHLGILEPLIRDRAQFGCPVIGLGIRETAIV